MSEITKMSPIAKREALATVLNRMANEISDEEKEEILKMYKQDDDIPKIDGQRHRVVTGVAYNAVNTVIQKGGCDAEVHRALKYLYICIHAVKYNLDYKQAYKELLIGYLLEKYGAKRPKKEST